MFYSSKAASGARSGALIALTPVSDLVLQTLQPTCPCPRLQVCVCTQPFMLLLLPQDLVPLKQGLWFDRLPVLGLQSNRPVGVAVLLSTCSWYCVVLPSVRPPLSILLCCTCWDSPSLSGAREGLCWMAENLWLGFVWDLCCTNFASGKDNRLQLLFFNSLPLG